MYENVSKRIWQEWLCLLKNSSLSQSKKFSCSIWPHNCNLDLVYHQLCTHWLLLPPGCEQITDSSEAKIGKEESYNPKVIKSLWMLNFAIIQSLMETIFTFGPWLLPTKTSFGFLKYYNPVIQTRRIVLKLSFETGTYQNLGLCKDLITIFSFCKIWLCTDFVMLKKILQIRD